MQFRCMPVAGSQLSLLTHHRLIGGLAGLNGWDGSGSGAVLLICICAQVSLSSLGACELVKV